MSLIGKTEEFIYTQADCDEWMERLYDVTNTCEEIKGRARRSRVHQKELIDADYILAHGAAWLEVDSFAIRIRRTDEGVSVAIYKNGDEINDSIAETHAYFTELDE
jgi:hypothetical protein